MTKTNQKGFTLIEIMVTITIIGILSAAVYASFAESRAQSRDKARMSALKEVELSLELYKSQNGRYPAAGCATSAAADVWRSPGGPVSSGSVTCEQYIASLVPDYIEKLPVDPVSEATNDRGIFYRTDANGTAYKLMFYGSVESLRIASYEDEFALCAAQSPSTGCSPVTSGQWATVGSTYAVYSLGAETWGK